MTGSRVISRALVLLAVVVAAVTAIVVVVKKAPPSDPLKRINLRYRRIQARLSVLDHTPLHVFRGAEPASDLGIAGVIAELTKRSQEDRSAENIHRLAIAELAGGSLAAAEKHLEEGTRLDPDNAAILSDRGVADFAAGRIADAAEWSARSLQRDPTFAPAAFNWALSLELLSNRAAAIDAWQAYLRLDGSGGGWADEAQQHLKRLREARPSWKEDRELLRATSDSAMIRRIVERYPQRVRSWVQTELLPRWLNHREPGDLALLRAIATARAASGDSLLLDVVEHASAHPSAVAEGFLAYATAQKALTARNFDGATAYYASAARTFREAGSPMEYIAETSAATTESYAGRNDAALARLDALQKRIAADRYPIAVTEAEWVRGLVLAQRGEWNDSLHANRRALDAARRARETEHEVALSGSIATDLERVGEAAGA